MNTRQYKFHARSEHTADTTVVIDLNMVDPVSLILLMFEFSKTGIVQTAHPVAAIKKIELIDGSDVLYSLDGFEADALDWYNNKGKFRWNYNQNLTASTCTRCIGLNFGRWLFDPEYAFDPNKFTNPQLRISLDIDAWAATANKVFITGWASLFDEKRPSLRGFLTSKEIKQYQMAANVHEYTDLPLDYPYRAIYFRPYLLGTEPNQAVANIKLSEDMDKKIPFDLGGQDLARIITERYPSVEESYWFSLDTAARNLYIAPTTCVTAVSAVWAETAVAQDAAFYDGDGGQLKTRATANPSNTQIHVKGYVPHAVFEIPCGETDDPADWWDVRHLGTLRMDITGGSTPVSYIFLQQLRTY